VYRSPLEFLKRLVGHLQRAQDADNLVVEVPRDVLAVAENEEASIVRFELLH
jgi:hypothetical protein